MSESELYGCSWSAGGDPGQQCLEPIYAEDLCRDHAHAYYELIRVNGTEGE